MKKSFLSLTVLAAAGMLFAASPKEDVLLTIAGKPVTLSEFEYLYHKNNSQQIAPQTIEEYLQMFITYKQKVAAAEDAGIDKTQAFQNEFDGYRRDLAKPYMSLQEVEDSIIAAEYARMAEEIDVSHIMLPFRTKDGRDPQELLSSVRDSILNQGADFEKMARKYSVDRAVVRNGGHMGYITANRLPIEFEMAAFETPVGQISDVIKTPAGYHIVKVNGRRPTRGSVHVEHILKLTQGLPAEEAAAKKHQIDSIYNLVTNGGDFEAIAKAESEDPGSAKDGGKLPWFGTGMMVPEFEKTAFELADGQISAPFPTSYGYHIIKKLGSRGRDSLSVVKPQIKAMMERDERGRLPYRRKVQQLYKKFKAQPRQKNIDAVIRQINEAGTVDSTLISNLAASEEALYSVAGHDVVPVSEVVANINMRPGMPADVAVQSFKDNMKQLVEATVMEQERLDLAVNNPDYRNLLNEYRDGMLLFEISDRNVWSKAKSDKAGLEKYFLANRDKYKWESPKLKSYIIFATSDSVMKKAQTYLATNPVSTDSLVNVMRKQFGKNVKVEKVIAAKGENAITDYIGFGGKKPEPSGKWAFYFPYGNRVVPAPEEAADERGLVTTDYQNKLEDEWREELSRRYPAKVNKKVLKKAK